MNTLYRVDFVMRNKCRYSKTVEMLEKAFDCEANGFEKETHAKTVSFGTDSEENAKKLLSAAYAFLDELIYPCFLSVIWTDAKRSESHELKTTYADLAADHNEAAAKVTFILSRFVLPDKFEDELKRYFDSIPYRCYRSGNTIEFSVIESKYTYCLYGAALSVLGKIIPDCFAGAYWIDFAGDNHEDCLKNTVKSMKRACISSETLYSFDDGLPDDIVIKASFSPKDSNQYFEMTQRLDMIFKCLNIDYTYDEPYENTIEYISNDKHEYFNMYRAMQSAVDCEKAPKLKRAVLKIYGEGIDRTEDYLPKPKEPYIHNICLKTEVAVECAASVTGFIFRNYDLKHIPYPKDIKEIYERNTYYEQNAYMCDSEKELDRILAEIKEDNEYVKAHTPLPHK